MSSRIKCKECGAESYNDSNTKLVCAKCFDSTISERDRYKEEAKLWREKVDELIRYEHTRDQFIQGTIDELAYTTKLYRKAEQLLDDTFSSPHSIDSATVPQDGIENHPEQVVLQYSISYTKYQRWLSYKKEVER